MSPRLKTIVWPIVNDSSGDVRKNPAMQRPLEIQPVGDDDVVEDGLEDLVRLARWGKQAGLEPFGDVRLGLLFPSTQTEHRRQLRGLRRCRRR
jgi:hypothetical protein